MRRWQEIIYRFISPSADIIDPLERQRAIILSSLFILAMGTSFFSFVILRALVLGLDSSLIFGIVGTAIYIPLLRLSRSSHYRIAAWVYILAATGLLVGSIFIGSSQSPSTGLNFLLGIMLIAGLVLSPIEAMLYSLVAVAIVIAMPYLKPSPNYATLNSVTLIISLGIGILGFSIITDRFKRRALESEARYRELMKANSEGILIIDEIDAKILDANPAIEKLLGYGIEDIIGRYPIEFIDKDFKTTIRSAWERRYQGIPMECRVLHKDGSQIYIEATLKPYNYLQKSAFVLTLVDISERKQVEALVIESEKRFRAIFNETSHFIGVLDARGMILELNEQGFEFFGLTPNNSLGRFLWEIPQWAHNETAIQRIQTVIEAAQQGTTVRYDVEVRDRHQNVVFLDFTLKPVHDLEGNVTMLIADSRDITAYKRAEAQRFEYERRYDALFKNTTDAIFVFTLDNNYITVNQRALDMLGYELDELAGQPISLVIVPDEFSQSQNLLKRLLDGEEIDVYERHIRKKNGEILTVEISLMLVRSADNKPMYFQSLVRDISERKRLERQQLEIAIEKERAKLLQDFIEKASHHFRTPLANLKTSVYLLPKFITNEKKHQEYLKIARQELDRLQVLLDDLITVVSLQKSDTDFNLARVSVSQLLSEIRATQEGSAFYPNFTWDWQLADDEAIVIGDKAILGRAFLNLLDNATLYTQVGGKISVHSRIEDKWLTLDIYDTGMGISENDMPHIFKDFYRSNDAMGIKVSSSGLGLTISKSIIERHQGTIRVESKVGKGTHFQILLPLYTAWTNTPPPMPKLPTE